MLGFNRWQLLEALAAIAAIVGIISLAPSYFIPAPPPTVTMATAFKGSTFEYYGQRYIGCVAPTTRNRQQLRAAMLLTATRLERDDFSSNRHLALASCWSMIFSENRCPLFGIML